MNEKIFFSLKTIIKKKILFFIKILKLYIISFNNKSIYSDKLYFFSN